MEAALLHRYALAAELCAGLRVLDAGGSPEGAALVAEAGATVRLALDDQAGLDEAERRADAGVLPELLAPADAVRRADRADADAVLVLGDTAIAPAELERLAQSGVKLLVCTTDRRSLAGLPGVRWLHQHVAEGSVLAPAEGDEPLGGHVELWGERDPDGATAHVACAGFDATVLDRAAARLEVVAAPVSAARLRELERANAELARANRELAHGIYGKHDAAAAAANAAYDEKVQELETRAWILGEEKRMAETRVAQLEAWRDAARYRAVDRAVVAVKRRPVVYGVLTRAKRAFRRVRPRG
ncbi:MAG: hypothetical protein QOE86_216 [Solirubrobacteraceae bacterium]|nr:hypothetical protein [Solirubrobacteraceae bacterium]